MHFDPLNEPYASRRSAVYARNGMVAASQPLAAQAGLEMLQRGGNAIDAAIAAAAALTVVEPTSNGIGGDAFALVWSQGKLHGLNASGPAPAKLSIESLRQAGFDAMPKTGFAPVTVPGAPAAWASLAEKFGRLPLAQSLEPAIRYAEEGFPISPVVGSYWRGAAQHYGGLLKGPEFAEWFRTFAPDGIGPSIGDIQKLPDHARTLQAIAETNAESFYRGKLAEAIDGFSRRFAGFLRLEDLAAYRPEWVEPIRIDYRGYDVWELPPNGSGLTALLALNILKGFEFAERDTADTLHLQLEAMKLAYADGKAYIADAGAMSVSAAELLSDAYARERRGLIGREAMAPGPGKPRRGGTVYLCTADREGNMVSFIQSNYMGFGSGLVVPGTGIALHNRGCGFSLDPADDNVLQPGKRPYHTIIPGFLGKNGAPVGPFGVMGGFMQPQGHVQVVMNAIDFGLNPQAALDAPRWQWLEGKTVEFEHATPRHLFDQLVRRGHDARWGRSAGAFGRGQMIWRTDAGVLVGGTEPRTDGHIAAW
ncbi:Glutathione hydrolase-like YwrD proenzyme [Cohnella sp. JJ-181]|nr:Glutathione hydrolase-like YwrD proenzyme [Cohnella sp. JJ-181]